MAKYDDLLIAGPRPWHPSGPGPVVASFDGTHVKGSLSYLIHWVLEKPTGIPGLSAWADMSHGPHIHKTPELIMHIGTNPDDPEDLGAEIEFFLGPEMEKHVITKSTVAFLPANFIHCPWTVKRVDRPFMLVQVNQEKQHTEKSYKELVPAEDRKRMMFIDEGFDDRPPARQMPEFVRKWIEDHR